MPAGPNRRSSAASRSSVKGTSDTGTGFGEGSMDMGENIPAAKFTK